MNGIETFSASSRRDRTELLLRENKQSVTKRLIDLDFLILGDGAIDVGDYDLVVPVPQVDGAFAATCALVLSGYAEGDIIRPLS